MYFSEKLELARQELEAKEDELTDVTNQFTAAEWEIEQCRGDYDKARAELKNAETVFALLHT